MLSVETETKLANIFLALAEGEKSIDINRQILIELDEFDPYEIFTFLDSEQKNKISSIDILNYLQEKGIFPNELEIKLIILFYDRDYDGLLSYPEFSFFLQSEYAQRKNISNVAAQNININITLSNIVEQALKQLLINEIELAKKIINLLDDLKKRYDFNIHDLYHAVKNWRYIEENSLRNFFDRNKISYLESDIRKIMKRLDFNGDGKIDLCELHAFLGFPHCKFCCPNDICNICGISGCNLCISDAPCFIHNCVHIKNPKENNKLDLEENNINNNINYQSENNNENQENNNNVNNLPYQEDNNEKQENNDNENNLNYPEKYNIRNDNENEKENQIKINHLPNSQIQKKRSKTPSANYNYENIDPNQMEDFSNENNNKNIIQVDKNQKLIKNNLNLNNSKNIENSEKRNIMNNNYVNDNNNNNDNESQSSNSFIGRVSDNLFLRLSPKRKYSPKSIHYNSNSSNIYKENKYPCNIIYKPEPCQKCILNHCKLCHNHNNNFNQNRQNIKCKICCNFPCSCCSICHNYPCKCCKNCHTFPCKCCKICKSTECICCKNCKKYPCVCCQKCHFVNCRCCNICNNYPCICCKVCHNASCICCKDCKKYPCICCRDSYSTNCHCCINCGYYPCRCYDMRCNCCQMCGNLINPNLKCQNYKNNSSIYYPHCNCNSFQIPGCTCGKKYIPMYLSKMNSLNCPIHNVHNMNNNQGYPFASKCPHNPKYINNNNNFPNNQNNIVTPNFNNNNINFPNSNYNNNQGPMDKNHNQRIPNKRDILSSFPFKQELTQFVDFLGYLMQVESRIEDMKIELAKKDDFNFEDIFRIFEVDGKEEYIEPEDLKQGLKLLGLNPTDFDIKLLMKRFDLNQQGLLSYTDVFDMVVSFEKNLRNSIQNRPPNSCCSCKSIDIFECDTLIAIKNLFKFIIECENEINRRRIHFDSLRANYTDIIQLLDSSRRGVINRNDLKSYLTQFNKFTTSKECDLLFIRLDKFRKGEVGIDQIENELLFLK